MQAAAEDPNNCKLQFQLRGFFLPYCVYPSFFYLSPFFSHHCGSFVLLLRFRSERERERARGMGRLFLVSLEGKIYSCKHCHTHLALSDDILSKVRSEPTFGALFLNLLCLLLGISDPIDKTESSDSFRRS